MIEEQKIREFLIGIVKNDDPLTWATDFDFRNTDLDSLDVVTLALKLEDASGTRIPDDRIEDMRSIEAVFRVVNTSNG